MDRSTQSHSSITGIADALWVLAGFSLGALAGVAIGMAAQALRELRLA